MKIALIVVALAIFASGGACAECRADKALSDAYLASLQRSADMANTALPILSAIGRINSKGTDPKRPLAEQISSADAEEFTRLASRLQAIQLAIYVESGRERDLKLALDMWDSMKSLMADRVPQDATPAGILEFMSKQLSDAPALGTPSGTECTVERALYEEALTAQRLTINEAEVTQRSNALAARLTAKYGAPSDHFDPTVLLPSELSELQSTRAEMKTAQDAETVVLDAQLIAYWLRTSDRVYRGRLNDVVVSGASIESLGKTTEAEAPSLQPFERTLLRVWQVVDMKVRSEVSKELESSNPAAANSNR